jgi:hypothetical protein
MARLVIRSPGFENRIMELKLGVNRLGRASSNDFAIEHPAISTTHCEVEMRDGELVVRDCGSTNGTFVAGRPIKEAKVARGQTFYLGDVEVLVESTEVTVAIPKFQVPADRPNPPVVLADGAMICPRHPHLRATHQCTHCLEVMCGECAHQLRRKGGRLHHLCPKCSHPCEPFGRPRKKKNSLISLVARTVKLPFARTPKERDRE